MDTFGININSEETLLKACELLSDAYCKNEDIKCESTKGTLDITFDREFLEDPSRVKVRKVLFILNLFEYPIVRSHFHLEGLNLCRISHTQKNLKGHNFIECEVKQNRYFLNFDILQLEIGFKSALNGYLKDIEFVEGKKGSFFSFKDNLNSYRSGT